MHEILLKDRSENDSEFFMELFGEIKSSELHLESWPEPIKNQLITMQFYAYEQCVKAEFPNNIDYLIIFQSEKAGRLQLDKNEQEIRIINISLLPVFQNLGIGTRIISEIIQEASQSKKPVFLEVDKSNPAYFLYKKLGFQEYNENELKFFMKRP